MKPFVKPIAMLALTMATMTPTHAQSVPVDTIKVIENAHQITITRNANTTCIEAWTSDADGGNIERYTYNVTMQDSTQNETFTESIFAGLPFMSDKKRNRKSATAVKTAKWKPKQQIYAVRNIYWGWNFAYDGKTGLKNCFEVGVAEVIGASWKPWRRGPEFSVGIGFGMKRFRTADDLLFAKDGDRLTIIPADLDECHDAKAHWDIWAFHLPLMLTQNITGDFAVAIGATVNFNTYSKAWSSYLADGVRHTTTFKGLQQRLLTIEPTAIIGFREAIAFYAKWNPMPVMQCGNGPRFKSWSMGVTLNF